MGLRKRFKKICLVGLTAALLAVTGCRGSGLDDITETVETEKVSVGEAATYRGFVVIDPGHQSHGNNDREPLYPDGIK